MERGTTLTKNYTITDEARNWQGWLTTENRQQTDGAPIYKPAFSTWTRPKGRSLPYTHCHFNVDFHDHDQIIHWFNYVVAFKRLRVSLLKVLGFHGVIIRSYVMFIFNFSIMFHVHFLQYIIWFFYFNFIVKKINNGIKIKKFYCWMTDLLNSVLCLTAQRISFNFIIWVTN